jgi:hypothetical protein
MVGIYPSAPWCGKRDQIDVSPLPLLSPQVVGEAVGYAHGRGQACRGLRRCAKNPHASGPLLANNLCWCAGRGAVGYAHR